MFPDPNIKLSYVWRPSIRTRFIGEDGREWFDLRLGLWLEVLSPEDREAVAKSEYLNRKQCRAFWKYLHRTDRAPKQLWIYLNREDFDRAFSKAFPKLDQP
jgi:hypothetical protein